MPENSRTDTDSNRQVRKSFYVRLGLKDKKSSPLDGVVKEESARHAEDLKITRDKVLYEDRLARVQATIAALGDYAPAADGLRSKFIESVLDAERLLRQQPQAYAEANEKLHLASVKNALAQAQRAWDKASATARNDQVAKPLLKRVDELRQQVKQARTVLTDLAIGVLMDEVQRIERKLLRRSLSQEEAAALSHALAALEIRLRDKVGKAESARVAAEVEQVKADNQLAQLKHPQPKGAVATQVKLALLQRLRTDAETAFAACEFELARQQFEALGSDAETTRLAAAQGYNTWALRQHEIQDARTSARNLAASATLPAVKAHAAALAQRLDEMAGGKVGTDILFETASRALDDAIALTRNLQDQEQAYAAFAAERQAAAARVHGAETAVEVALLDLRAAVQGAENDLADRPFMDRLDKARSDWQARLKNAVDAAALDEAGALRTLSQITQDMAAAMNDPEQLARLMAAESLRRAQALYDQARATARSQIQQLTNIDAVAGAASLTALDSLHAGLDARGSPGAYEAALAQAQRIGRDADKAAATRGREVAERQDALNTRLEPLAGQLEQLFAAAQKRRNVEEQKLHLQMHETLKAALDGLRATARLTQLPLLDEATREAERLAWDVSRSLAAAAGKSSSDGSNVLSFADAKKRITKLKVKLNHKDVQTYRKVTAFDAEEAVKALETSMAAVTMSALKRSLDDLTIRVDAIEEGAGRAKEAFKSFEKHEVQPVRARLAETPFVDAQAYASALDGRLKAVLADARFEDGLEGARAKLQQIRDEMDQACAGNADPSGLPAAIVAKDAEARAAVRKAELDKARFEAEVTVLSKQIESAKGLHAGDHEGLRQALRDAKNAGTKANAVSDAREQLQAIRTRLMLLTQNPQGLAIHARKQLPGVRRRYKAAVAAYWQGLDAVALAVDELPGADLSDASRSVVRTTLNSLRALFNPAVFDQTLPQVGNEALDAAARSAAREAALREVRRLGAYLSDDYRLQELAATPFHAPMRGLLSELRLSLLDVENNLLVSM